MAAVLGVSALAALTGSLMTTGGGGNRLGTVLGKLERPTRYSFRHVPMGTRVTDCFLPNREFVIAVDLAAGVMLIRNLMGRELARRVDREVYVAAAALGRDDDAWLAASLPVGEDLRGRLVDVVGVDLARYLVADGLPADPVTAARELADAGTTIETLTAGRYRVALDEDAVGGLTGVNVDIELRDDRVAEIAVTPKSDADGWRTVYGAGEPLAPRAPAAVLPLDGSIARVPSTSCELAL